MSETGELFDDDTAIRSPYISWLTRHSIDALQPEFDQAREQAVGRGVRVEQVIAEGIPGNLSSIAKTAVGQAVALSDIGKGQLSVSEAIDELERAKREETGWMHALSDQAVGKAIGGQTITKYGEWLDAQEPKRLYHGQSNTRGSIDFSFSLPVLELAALGQRKYETPGKTDDSFGTFVRHITTAAEQSNYYRKLETVIYNRVGALAMMRTNQRLQTSHDVGSIYARLLTQGDLATEPLMQRVVLGGQAIFQPVFAPAMAKLLPNVTAMDGITAYNPVRYTGQLIASLSGSGIADFDKTSMLQRSLDKRVNHSSSYDRYIIFANAIRKHTAEPPLDSASLTDLPDAAQTLLYFCRMPGYEDIFPDEIAVEDAQINILRELVRLAT